MWRQVLSRQQGYEGPDWPALLVLGSLVFIWMIFLAVTAFRLLTA
jgi:hypothetical protein